MLSTILLLSLVAQAPGTDGKVHGVLREKLAAAAPLPVVFWLELPSQRQDLRVVLERARRYGADPEEARREALGVAEEGVAIAREPFLAELASRAITVDYADPYVPIVFATLAPATITALAARDEVDAVYYAFPEWQAEGAAPIEWSTASARADFVHRKGVTGAGVKVLVNDTRAIDPSNPHLPPLVVGNPAISIGSHATAVAGILASRHPQSTGTAPGLTSLYDYGGSGDIDAPQAWTWAMQQGVSFGNCSWWNFHKGSIEFLDRYFDYIIRNFAVMMFKSAGNQGNGEYVTTPGNGFNVTATGNADDFDSLDWLDDSLWAFSSTRNPVEGHEKPELAAHGTAVASTTTFAPWIGSVGSGTSFASPVACGTAALLAATDSALLVKPEAVKALLMAGAWNNVDGGEPLSDRDGAGAVDAAASQRAVADGQYHAAVLTAGSFAGGVYAVPVQLDANDETRIVAVWFSAADSAAASDSLQMDLDLRVRDPSGAVVAQRSSAHDPFEIVQFVPPSTGTYTVELMHTRFTGTTEPFALAWTTRQDAATDSVTVLGSGAPLTTVRFDFIDPYHPGELYIAMLSATPYPATIPLGPNKMLPFGWDGLCAASLSSLPGFVGRLDASGEAVATLLVPPIPPVTLQIGMITFRNNPSRAEETSDVVTFTIGS